MEPDDGFDEARRLWTRLYLDIPHEEGCFEPGKETNPDEFPLLRAKHLSRLVHEERQAAAREIVDGMATFSCLNSPGPLFDAGVSFAVDRLSQQIRSNFGIQEGGDA